jgi:hypothetical protein
VAPLSDAFSLELGEARSGDSTFELGSFYEAVINEAILDRPQLTHYEGLQIIRDIAASHLLD